MPYTIGKTFSFAAAHRLPLLPATHKCHRNHGHNYLVTYTLAAEELDAYGFVVDYGDLSIHWQTVHEMVDHKDLTDVFTWALTAENLARFFFERCLEDGFPVESVRVQETPLTFAEYRP